MPNSGDTYVVEIKQAHLEWGTHRHTSTRNAIYGEGYIQIPAPEARNFGISNSRDPHNSAVYSCSSTDGYLNNEALLASGTNSGGENLAKQFQGHGNLQLIGNWYQHVNAQEGDFVRIFFTGSNSMLIEYIPNPTPTLF